MAIVVELVVVVVVVVVEVSIARPIILLLGWGSWKGDVHPHINSSFAEVLLCHLSAYSAEYM